MVSSMLAHLALWCGLLFPQQATPAVVVPPAPAHQVSLAAPKDNVYDLLDRDDTEALGQIPPARLLKEIRKGRSISDSEAGSRLQSIDSGSGRKTECRIVVPKKPRGALILLHGLGGDADQLVPHFAPWATKNHLIVAAPTAQKLLDDLNEDWSETSSRLPHWWHYRPSSFAMELLEQLKKSYGIDENLVFLSGYSMGGFGTWNLGLRFPDRFAAIVPIAGGISQREYALDDDAEIRKILVNALNLPTYILHGSDDRTVPVRFDRSSRDALQKLGYPFEYTEVKGAGHIMNVTHGSPLMKGIQQWLGRHKREPHPSTVRLHCLGDYMNQSYWVRIDERADKGPADITAAVDKKNNIRVEAVGVKRFTLFMDDELLKLSRKVTVEVNGRECFSDKVETSTAVILESWKARRDRHLLYSAKVEIDLSK